MKTSKKTHEAETEQMCEKEVEPVSSKMVRTLTGHQINECNEAIHITADERDPSSGNASHAYRLTVVPPPDAGPSFVVDLPFQHGPIKEVGTNGITHEALIEVMIDRLEGFQSGPYACEENAQALQGLYLTRAALRTRTKARLARGVEGTHTV